MAVELQTKETHSTKQILEAFNIDKAVITAFGKQGYSIAITPTSLKISLKKAGGSTPVASVPVKAGAALFAMKGSLAASSLQSVAYKIMGVINPLIGNEAKKSASMGVIEEKLATKPKASVKVAVPEPTFHVAEPVLDVPIKKTKTSGKVVSLVAATKLYQKVKGTTDTSRYVVIALSDELGVAARYNGSTLSIRVEGNVASNKQRIAEAGFDLKSDTYASLHLKTGSQLIARRAASSVLGGLDIEFTTPWPDFKKMSEGV